MKLFLKSVVCAAVLMFGTTASGAKIDSDLMAGLEARLIGPAAMSGRMTAVDVVLSDTNRIVAGSAAGGVWISNNGGLNWKPVFDKEECASVGALAINQSNPDIIWVGTGEGNVRNSTSIGCGMFKSLDGGNTWQKIGLAKSERINRIALHPTDENIAYAAVLGALWGDSDERGIYKTTDGGKTWNKILYVNERVGATDVRMDPTNPNKLFASMWNFRRWPYQFKSLSEGSGMFVSHNGGETWKELTKEDGLPQDSIGRSAVAISPTNSNRVYALVEGEAEGYVIRSDDGGRSWTEVNSDKGINDRPFYYNEIRVDPINPDIVYQLGTFVKKSIDGGKTFKQISAINCCAPGNAVHIDNHDLWINPSNPNHMIDVNDGGLAITNDRGNTWRFVENLPVGQFYHIAVDNELPYNVYGGMQDNGSWRGPAEVFDRGGIRNLHWQEISFGDGFDVLPDPSNAMRGLTMYQGGNLMTWDLETNETRFIRPPAPDTNTTLRFNWNAALGQSPFDVDTIFYGSQFLHKSTDRGLTWEIISGDLTTNNTKEQQASRNTGGLTPDSSGAELYNTISVISPSPIDANVIWVGTDDGRVHVTRDGGTTWKSVEKYIKRGGPKGAWVPMIEPSQHDASIAYVVMDDHRRGDHKPYAYKLENYGKRWINLVDEAVSGYALSIRQDHVDAKLLFLGTEFGLHFSVDGGKNWTKWTAGVPTTSVMDLAIQKRENDLVLGTHGRAALVVDDYSALRGLTEADFKVPLKLLSLTDGQQYESKVAPSSRFTGSGEFRGENEPYGVLITFMASGNELTHPDVDKDKERLITLRAKKAVEIIKEKGKKGENTEDKKLPAKVTVKVANTAGDVIRTFKADVHQGINRIVWDMTQDGILYAPPSEVPEDGIKPAGLEVVPGTYTVTVEHSDNSVTGSVEVLKDPLSPFSDEERAANFSALMELQALDETMQNALREVMGAQRDLELLDKLIKAAKVNAEEDVFKELSEKVKGLKDAFREAEETFRTPSDVAGIVFDDDKVSSIMFDAYAYLASTKGAPNDAAWKQLAKVEIALHKAIEDLNKLIVVDLVAFKAEVDKAGIGLFKQQSISISK